MGQAAPKQSVKFARRGKFTKAYQPKKVTNWVENVIAQSKEYAPEKPFKAAMLNLSFEYSWPKSMTKKERKWREEHNCYWKLTSPDIDNLRKNTMDALSTCGMFWENDARIVVGTTYKKYGDKKCVKVEIIEINVDGVKI